MSKAPSTLPLIQKKSFMGSHSQSSSRSTSAKKSKSTQKPLNLTPSRDILVHHCVKRLSTWFKSWHTWQRRVCICQVMEHCSKQHLEFLATSLEPLLHLDFSSSLIPPMQSLHLDGAATFQVQRSVMQSLVNPAVLEAKESMSCLDSIPTTLLSSTTSNIGCSLQLPKVTPNPSSDSTVACTSNTHILPPPLVVMTTERETILPALPLTHVQHATGLSSHRTSLEDIAALRHKRYSSVPDFKSTTHLLKTVKQRETLKLSPPKDRHRRSKSTGSIYNFSFKFQHQSRERLAESFKGQLALLSEWMVKWQGTQKAFLLLEMVKLCDKNLLGYFVQCLYQRLQDKVNLDSLPDLLLKKIFAYLEPQTLCRCSQVCRKWQHLSSTTDLWKRRCQLLGKKEGVGDLANAVEVAASHSSILAKASSSEISVVRSEHSKEKVQGSETFVDWKRAYRDLSQVMLKIKGMVVKAAAATAEQEKAEKHQIESSQITSTAIRTSYSLQEMIKILREQTPNGGRTTRELLVSAPESAAAKRRRVREERKLATEAIEIEEKVQLESSKYQHRRPCDRSRTTTPGQSSRVTPRFGTPIEGVLHHYGTDLANQLRLATGLNTATGNLTAPLIDVAIDRRPSIPSLPDPDGIECLILAGCLLGGQKPRPGRAQTLPRLRRFKLFGAAVLCVQCDPRKIVMGTGDRTILVHDIRSGRLVHTLQGHKGSVQCLQFDGHKIVSGSWDTTCIVWDVVNFNPIRELHGHTDRVSSLQFDQEIMVSGSYDKTLRVWSTSSWECIAVITSAHEASITCVKFDGSMIISGSMDKTVKVWSRLSYQCLATFEHSAAVTAVLISNLLLVSAAFDGSVTLWSLHSHKTLMHWDIPSHAGHLTDLTASGSRLYGTSSDAVLFEWDICTGTCSRTLVGHSMAITCIWAGDNKIVTASEDRTVCVWYTKKAIAKESANNEEDSDQNMFPDLPIRLITELNL